MKCQPDPGQTQVLERTVDLRPDGLGYTDVNDLPSDHRFFRYQEKVNAGGSPGEQVIDMNRAEQGREYRDETEGDNPIIDLRERQHTS